MWDSDGRGRLVASRGANARPAPHVVISVARDGQTFAIGSAVPDALAAEIESAVAGAALSPPDQPPASLARCQELLAALGPVERQSGPSYLIPPGTAFDSGADVRRSDAADVEAMRDYSADRRDWSVEEWRLLLDGAYGPWAVALDGARVIAICHSARLTDRGAEAGVWTDPGYRGRGHASAVTAAWASLPALAGRRLFYSTSAENISSQRVAARLGLRPIGWTWLLHGRQATGGA